MDGLFYAAVVLITAMIAYYIGFKHGGITFHKNLLETEAEMFPVVPFETIEEYVIAQIRKVPVEQVRAEKIGHEYDRD